MGVTYMNSLCGSKDEPRSPAFEKEILIRKHKVLIAYLLDRECIVRHQGERCCTANNVLDLKSVQARIVCSLELELHEIHNVQRGSDEEDLHGCVIDRDKVSKVCVPCQEDRRIQSLGFERYA